MLCIFFFFQAEDGIRDIGVTGVQTCALPIFIVAFVILALYTYNSGLRAPELIAFVKDTLIYLTIIVAVIVIPAKLEIGRASCRERVEISVVAVSLKKKKQNRIVQR